MKAFTRSDPERPRGWFRLVPVLALGVLLSAALQVEGEAIDYSDEDYVPEHSEHEITSRVDQALADLQAQVGVVPRNTRRVHAVRVVDWFLDETGHAAGGRVLPGAPFNRTGSNGDLTEVRMTGWQLDEVPRVLYANAGERILLATLNEDAQAARVIGEQVVLASTGQTWVPVELTGWIATADLTGDSETLWAYAQALYVANCAQCHAAPHLDEFDANQWSGQFDAMLDQTAFTREDARLVRTYLQLHAAAPMMPNAETEIAMGQLLYRQLCESCHGETATAGASGDIRNTGASMLRSVRGGFESMPAIVMTDADIDRIIAYLSSLRTSQ